MNWPTWKGLDNVSLGSRVNPVYLGIGPSLLVYLCWNQAITIIGPVVAAVLYYSLPVSRRVPA